MADEPIKILTDKDIGAAIPRLIKEANEFFTLVSPFTSFVGSWLSDITNATQNGIEVTVVYNPHGFDDQPPKNPHLERLPIGVAKYPVEFLHAKIYLTDKSVIITSMNYTSGSNSNREIAVRFNRHDAKQAYDEVRKYVDELLERVPDRNKGETAQRLEKTQGHCIYCGTVVSYNPERPLCYPHWKPGLSDKPTTKHNYCHSCGKERETTFRQPLCEECREQKQGVRVSKA